MKNPMYVLEGEHWNWEGAAAFLAGRIENPNVRIFKVDGYNHFNVIAPPAEMLAPQIIKGEVKVTPEALLDLQ